MPKVYFLDVTNRDAAQASRIALAKLQKTMINIYLGEMGVHQSEFGFPFIKHEQNYIAANLELKELEAMGTLTLSGWCRAIAGDVNRSLHAGVKHLNVSISTSDQMISHKFQGRLNRAKIIQEMVEAVTFAHKGGALTVGVNAEDASRTDMGYLKEFTQAAKDAGANRFRYCDTLGFDTPMSIYERVKCLAENVGIAIELHCHNDLGMAVANSVAGARAAVDGGVDAYINTSINGFGERAGQADLLSCIVAMKFGQDMDAYSIGDTINLEVSSKIAKYTAYAFGHPLPINQPGVGSNAFAHEAGVHADGTLKNRRNYELFDYELLGIDDQERVNSGRVITTGEYGGLAGFKHVYGNLGIEFPDDSTADEILELVRFANAHTQLPLLPDELTFIAKYPDQVRKVLTVIP